MVAAIRKHFHWKHPPKNKNIFLLIEEKCENGGLVYIEGLL
jgi:hypothetical protein